MINRGTENKMRDEFIDRIIKLKPNAKYFVDFYGVHDSMSFNNDLDKRGKRQTVSIEDNSFIKQAKLYANMI